MARPTSRPVFVVVPGAAQTPSHYAHLLHLLHLAGYPTLSALLPSTGTGENATAEDDKEYIRTRMVLPVLDIEKHNVILVMHSYSGMPGSAAVTGLGKSDRAAQGKTTSVLGQIFIAAILPRGGDGKDVVATFGGHLPPHISADEAAGLLTCEDPAPPLFSDVTPQAYQDAMVLSTICPSLASFNSPCPRASWDSEAFKGRIAFIRTANDRAVPYEVQNMLIQGTEQDFIVKDIETGHNAQLVEPEKLSGILVELAKQFEEL